MRPRPTRHARVLVVAVGAAVTLTALLAGCGADVTRSRVERSIGPTFTNLYVQQQALLGHPGLAPAAVAPRAACHRTNPAAHDVGAGSDWVCQLTWNDVHRTTENGKFELTVHPDGCYEAGGPTKIVGPLTIRAASGKDVTNPVFEFDACFDTT
jgi:hypothetical protein